VYGTKWKILQNRSRREPHRSPKAIVRATGRVSGICKAISKAKVSFMAPFGSVPEDLRGEEVLSRMRSRIA
jgi:hypothetical protein